MIEGSAVARHVRQATAGGTAGELMRQVTLIAHADELVHDLLSRMARAGVERCPVVGADDVLAGFISPSDLVRARFRRVESDETLRF
jgi:CBS-domain-containing membrane protein